MNDSFRAFLTLLKDALLEIGVSNDCMDRGTPEESERIYDRAQKRILKAFENISVEDRDVFHLLFGSKTEFDRTSWSGPYDYILVLIERNPEISVQRLRDRLPRFLHQMESLKSSSSAITETVNLSFNGKYEPSLLEGFLMLLTHHVEPPGYYYEVIDGVFTDFRFTLEGSGFVTQVKNKIFEYNMLLHGVWIHSRHPMKQRQQQQITLVYEKEEAATGHKLKHALMQEFESHSWVLNAAE